MILKKIFRFFGFVKRQEKQVLQEDNISQQSTSPMLLSKLGKPTTDLEKQGISPVDSVRTSNQHFHFLLYGFDGPD